MKDFFVNLSKNALFAHLVWVVALALAVYFKNSIPLVYQIFEPICAQNESCKVLLASGQVTTITPVAVTAPAGATSTETTDAGTVSVKVAIPVNTSATTAQ